MADEESVQDSRGGVPEDITIGGASLASQGSAAVFQQRACRTLLEIEQVKVIVCKGDCALPGLKVYVANQIAATQSLLSMFLGSLHLQSKNAAGENVQKLKHIQDEFVSNLEVMKKFKERVHQYDMRNPL